MFLIVDTLSNNVLAECGTYQLAEQQRIELIGVNPEFAEYIEVVDMKHELAAQAKAEKADRRTAQTA